MSCKMLGWMKYKLESRLPGEIPNTSDMQMTPPWWQKVKRNWRALDYSERGEWKSLKLVIQKTKIMASSPITSWQIAGETIETVRDFIFSGSKNHCIWGLQPWNLKTLAPWKKSYDKPRQHIKKQRHYFANKGPYSQSCDFSSSYIMDARVGQ